MIARVGLVIKALILRLVGMLLTRTPLVRVPLYVANGWRIKRASGRRVVPPFVERRTHACYQIVRYHRVADEQDPFFGAVSVKTFAEEMELLSTHFTVSPLEELIQRATRNDLPPNAVAITFDDGYQDNYEFAFPILKRFGLPATIFVTTGPLDSKTPLWHDIVFDAFRRANAEAISFDGNNYSLTTLTEKRIALKAFRRHLRIQRPADWDIHIRQLVTQLQLSGPASPDAKKLSWEEIGEMSRHHITFGAHTVTHPILTCLPLQDAMREIVTSKETLEGHLRMPVRLFAYPNGGPNDFNEAVKNILRDAGFLCAATILPGVNDAHTDPLELRRVEMWDCNTGISAFRLCMDRFLS